MAQLWTGLQWGLGILVAVMLAGMPEGAWGQSPSGPPSQAGSVQEVTVPPTPRTFGTASVVSHTVPAESFAPFSLTFPDTYDGTGSTRFCAIADCILRASVLLPAGAQVTFFEVDGCDVNAGANFTVEFRRLATNNGTPLVLATATSSGSGGCGFITQFLPTPETIDNEDSSYVLRFNSPVGDSTLRLQTVRIGYQLQVSPAPTVATFADVPTSHPFFRFIEALVASGITAGCGGGNYCPDAPLTRGQMAVFLSLGLGLHFAP